MATPKIFSRPGAVSSAPLLKKQTYRLGLLLPTTGTGAPVVAHALRGLPLMVDEINGRGGFLGKYPVELVHRDTGMSPDIGAREAEALIVREGVRAIVGPYSSTVAAAVQEVTEKHRVLLLLASANSSKIIERASTDYTFMFCPNSKMQSSAVALTTARDARARSWNTFVSIGQDYEWGHNTHAGFLTRLSQVLPTARELKKLWFKPGEANLSRYISEAVAAKPDFIFVAISGGDSQTFLRQAAAQRIFGNIPVRGAMVNVNDLKDQRGSLPRGLWGLARCPFFAHSRERLMKQYIKRDCDRFGPEGFPDDWACMNYDAVAGLEQGINKAGSIETDAVVRALKGATIETCRGIRSFRDSNNQLDVPSYIGQVWDSPDYKFPIFKPDSLAVVEGTRVRIRTAAA